MKDALINTFLTEEQTQQQTVEHSAELKEKKDGKSNKRPSAEIVACTTTKLKITGNLRLLSSTKLKDRTQRKIAPSARRCTNGRIEPQKNPTPTFELLTSQLPTVHEH